MLAPGTPGTIVGTDTAGVPTSRLCRSVPIPRHQRTNDITSALAFAAGSLHLALPCAEASQQVEQPQAGQAQEEQQSQSALR